MAKPRMGQGGRDNKGFGCDSIQVIEEREKKDILRCMRGAAVRPSPPPPSVFFLPFTQNTQPIPEIIDLFAANANLKKNRFTPSQST